MKTLGRYMRIVKSINQPKSLGGIRDEAVRVAKDTDTSGRKCPCVQTHGSIQRWMMSAS